MSVGVVVRRYIDFPIILIPTYFLVHFFNVFRSCSSTFCNLFNNFFAQYKQT